MSERESPPDDQRPTESAWTGEQQDESTSGGQLGDYRLLDKVGAGGMGEVWLAEQVAPVRRRVALKIIKRGLETERVIARFEAERQALALMDHPSIAKVLDAGTSAGGRPYFVMEYVPGVPITEHCDRQRLDARERLELFIQVCDAVQHAHQKAIIHRDLKPSNVLVATQADRPVPKVIDFGVAKATAQRLTERTIYTELGVLIGTPEYMSPEQAEMTGQDVDTRTDVYSLGMILYELLVGALPFDPKELRRAGFDEIRRRIREEEPYKPSARISSLDDADSTESARRRRVDVPTLRRQLSGDLDWITMKALEKDRQRRYGSPSELADDVRRHLTDQPVVAGPPSARYRLRKFLRRHRAGVLVGSVLTVSLVAGLTGTLGGLFGMQRAAAETETARAISTFLTDMFTAVDPSSGQRPVTVEEMLDMGSAHVDEAFRDRPEVEAAVREIVGTVYSQLGQYEQAEFHLLRAHEIRRGEWGADHPDTVDSLNLVAINYFRNRRLDEAASTFREVLEIHRRTLGPDDEDTLTSMHNLAAAALAQQKHDEAEPLLEECLAGRTRVLGSDHAATISTANNLAELYKHTGRLGEAEPLLVRGLEARSARMGNKHPRTLISLFNLGELYEKMGRIDDAEPMIDEARAGFREVMGEDHPYTLLAVRELADVRLQQGRLEEAEREANEAYRLFHDRYGDEHTETQQVIDLLVRLYERRSDARRTAEWRAKLRPPASVEAPRQAPIPE